MSTERVLTVYGPKPTRPITDFLQVTDYQGPKAGTYYVDGNVAATGTGSPDHPYSTLAEAIAASDAAMALSANRWWARRNKIFACGDALSENLVKFPTKCDIIGCGSYDGYANQLGLSGRHVPVGEAYGTRFFNVHFKAVAHASPIVTLTSAASGIEFHDCTFNGTLGTMTSGILATASPFLKVRNCLFTGTFATSYITFGTGETGMTEITGNTMTGVAAKGIVVGAGATIGTGWYPVISDNIIKATGFTIDDDANIFMVINNRLITDADIDGGATAGIDCYNEWASGNIITGTGTEGQCDTFPHTLIV